MAGISKAERLERARELLENEGYLVSKDSDEIKDYLEESSEMVIFPTYAEVREYAKEQYAIVESVEDVLEQASEFNVPVFDVEGLSLGELNEIKENNEQLIELLF